MRGYLAMIGKWALAGLIFGLAVHFLGLEPGLIKMLDSGHAITQLGMTPDQP